MNSSVWAVLAVRIVRGKKVDLSFSEQLFWVFFFQLFVGKTMNSKIFENIVGSALNSYTA